MMNHTKMTWFNTISLIASKEVVIFAKTVILTIDQMIFSDDSTSKMYRAPASPGGPTF